MAVRQIRLLGDPALRERCEPVERVDEEVRALVDDLFETMYAADGIGLAAPQVGVPRRVFVYDVREPGVEPGVLINPRLEEEEGTVREPEGCLSIPGLEETVERRRRVVFRGLDREGREVRVDADGLLSRCLQHENDHLDGVLFLDHLSPLKRKMLLAKWARRDG
ncbi:MAG: peptide deformylase [Gemmatimonadota bacterium]|nr:peptide deformylase [Gemmatimonadota bacterium]